MAAAFICPLLAAPEAAKPLVRSGRAPATQAQGDLVDLAVNAGYDTSGLPFNTLVSALETYSHARLIRASWSMLLAMNQMNTTVLYDRRRHRVIVFRQGGSDLGTYRDYVRFTGVQESVFIRLADTCRDEYSEQAEGFFKHDLGTRRKAPKD